MFVLTDETGKVLAATDGGAGDLAKSLAVGEPILKSHVSGYTRKDGTFVKEHEDGRQAAQPDPRVPHFGAHHAELAASQRPGDLDHEASQTAAGHMRAGDKESLAAHLRGLDTAARDHVLDHVHPDHWEGLGFRPLDHAAAKAKFEQKFGGGKGGDAPAVTKGGQKPAAAADKSAGKGEGKPAKAPGMKDAPTPEAVAKVLGEGAVNAPGMGPYKAVPPGKGDKAFADASSALQAMGFTAKDQKPIRHGNGMTVFSHPSGAQATLTCADNGAKEVVSVAFKPAAAN